MNMDFHSSYGVLDTEHVTNKIVHPKMKILPSFTQPHMVTNLEDILEMFFCRYNESQGSNIVLEPNDFPCISKNS